MSKKLGSDRMSFYLSEAANDVRDMMLEAVEKRFATTRAPHAIEHLSDNGSAYTARDTRLFAQARG